MSRTVPGHTPTSTFAGCTEAHRRAEIERDTKKRRSSRGSGCHPNSMAMPVNTHVRVRQFALVVVVAVCCCTPRCAALQNGFMLPQMGWNSWNHFGCRVTEADVRAVADAFVSTGMKQAGYAYVNVDDCWMAKARTPGGRLTHDPVRFPVGSHCD